VELIRYDGRAAGPLAELVHGLYAEEYPPGPHPAEWSDGLWARHRARDGFRLIVAREHGGVAGLTWGYVGWRGQYWSDEVAARLPPETADAWVGGHFEVVELLVRPAFRRRGVATTLLQALLSDAPADRAMLTVRDTAAAARRLYDSTGWTEVGRWEPDLTIMGKPLR
jgi:ribosomal protein S18 acetylase RimI-like enzyme